MPKFTELQASQNFLTSSAVISRLLDAAPIGKEDTVVEIGAGKGHITRALAQRCAKVLAWELDEALAARLVGNLPPNVRLFHGDFLAAPLPRGAYRVFANIPFCRTTAIVRRLTQCLNPPQSIHIVVEKGAALRFCGLPRESVSSLLLHPWFDVRIARSLRREDFHPAPRVDCALLELIKRPQPDLPRGLQGKWERFLRQDRLPLTPKQVRMALRSASLPPISPDGKMLYVQWLCLFRCWLSLTGGRK